MQLSWLTPGQRQTFICASACFLQYPAFLYLDETRMLQAEPSAPGMHVDPNNSAWLGCITAEGALMAGEVVAMLDGVASEEECCMECRALPTANVWNYCSANQSDACRCVVGRPGPAL